jgi:hypothetical protein
MSQELTENIISKLENPQLVNERDKNENTTFRITIFFQITQCSKHIYCVA